MIIKQEQKDELVRRAQEQLNDAIASLRFAQAIIIGEEVAVDNGVFAGITTPTNHRRLSPSAKKRISDQMKKAWMKRKRAAKGEAGGMKKTKGQQKYGPNNPHWTQTPAGQKRNKKILAMAVKAKALKARQASKAA